MGDRRLRALERRWLESGAADDQEAYLAELARRGERPVCRRCGEAFSQLENARAESRPVRMPWGETQETLVRGCNLTYTPLGERGLAQIAEAYQGPDCRYHPEPFQENPTWGLEDEEYYGCCWSFREDMPGCQLGPHVPGG